ncbi:unnamed protein product [Tilletia controversa]|uniref:N-acetyltransferase domain-containing protein n=1 Tax=Tilletia caries TaxID=13290 RepID=A0A177T216_9BASI|nr:hypothetical protein CF328_g8896 [Tilletia controversa]KAE8181629.1 hypothetical protein CF335_g8870 [Tilletia laevis]KAE8238192.1 hypothetical protein A4X03_0g8914 [Tilletia caries]CAD6886011.1 unnamed protein product [Tilletia caries]CAD6897709.1 unnamed protein product [Tilletia caries]
MDLSDFAIEPLREDCLDAAAEIFAVSFADGFRAVFPRGPTKDMVRFLRGELARAMARADTEEPSAMYPHAKDCRGGMRGKIRAFVARHRPTGQLAGFYVNELYENGRAARHGPVPPSERFPEGGDELLFDTFHQTSAASMRKFFGDESFAYYEFAAVSPAFRSSGVRAALSHYSQLTLLYEWNDPPAYNEALPLAKKLWARNGFKLLADNDINALTDKIRADRGELPPRGTSGDRLVVHPMRRDISMVKTFEKNGGVRTAMACLVPRAVDDVWTRSETESSHTHAAVQQAKL